MFGGKSMKKYRPKRGKTAKRGKTMKKRGGGVSSEIARAALPFGIYALQRFMDKPENKRKLRKLNRTIKRNMRKVIRR